MQIEKSSFPPIVEEYLKLSKRVRAQLVANNGIPPYKMPDKPVGNKCYRCGARDIDFEFSYINYAWVSSDEFCQECLSFDNHVSMYRYLQDKASLPRAFRKACFKDYSDSGKFYPVHKVIQKVIDAWVSKHFPPTTNLDSGYLFGPYGAGKTYLASAVFNQRLGQLSKDYIKQNKQKNKYPLYWQFQMLLAKEKSTFSSGKESYVNSAMNCDLLFLDELGHEYSNIEWSAEVLMRIISYRDANELPTIITTNIMSRSEFEARYGGATASRIFGPWNILDFSGCPDFRGVK